MSDDLLVRHCRLATGDLDEGYGAVQALQLEISPNRLLFLTIAGDVVRRAAEKRYGSAAALGALPPQLPLDAPAAATLRSLIRWTAQEADRPDSILHHSAPSRLHLRSTMVSMFLDCLDWARPELPRGREHVAEARIRRIEDWMDAHITDDVGIEDFAACAGLSVRAVQTGFRRLRNCTPTQAFIRRRLQRVRDALETPVPGTSVTTAATECGFVQLGRFAARYREAFGETPRTTLARGRRRA